MPFFVDFKSAFDTVWRDGLFYKMKLMGIDGNILQLLQNMYQQVQYCVKLNGKVSKPFNSSIGVKQGCVFSPLLFNMYVSDIPDIFDDACHPVTVNSLTTNSMLFVDDLVLLSESAEGIQRCLGKLENYCLQWGLTINQDKTKVIIFNKGGKKLQKFKFYVNDSEIEIAQSYCYLGIIFSSCGTFNRAISALHDKARKAFFALKQMETSQHPLLTISLFDKLVLPIMTYAVEVWGPFLLHKSKCAKSCSLKSTLEHQVLEKLNLHLCKYLLGVSRKSTNDAVRWEMGRLPILLLTVKRWFSFANHAFCSPNDSFLKISLISNNPAADELEQFSWRSRLLQTLEVSNLIAYPDVPLLSLFHSDIGTECRNRLSSLYIQGWRDSIDKIGNQSTGHKLQTYSKIKDYFGMENYILLLPVAKRRHFTKLKISAHHLSIERGGYTRPVTPRHERYCFDCNEMMIGDEFHFMLKCPKYAWERSKMFQQLSEVCNLANDGDFDTFVTLMQHCHGDTEVASIVCNFVKDCFTCS